MRATLKVKYNREIKFRELTCGDPEFLTFSQIFFKSTCCS